MLDFFKKTKYLIISIVLFALALTIFLIYFFKLIFFHSKFLNYWPVLLLVLLFISSSVFSIISIKETKKWKKGFSVVALVINSLVSIPSIVISFLGPLATISAIYEEPILQQKIDDLYGSPHTLINNFSFEPFNTYTDLNTNLEKKYYDIDGLLKPQILSINFNRIDNTSIPLNYQHYFSYCLSVDNANVRLMVYENGFAYINVDIDTYSIYPVGYSKRLYFEFTSSEFSSAYEIAINISKGEEV